MVINCIPLHWVFFVRAGGWNAVFQSPHLVQVVNWESLELLQLATGKIKANLSNWITKGDELVVTVNRHKYEVFLAYHNN